ncbi:hypothetical protein TSUD_41040 [Trifolium subterraneum]|nr:hypothetical protein TSUD_41040 [Trifolium subterraneum]
MSQSPESKIVGMETETPPPGMSKVPLHRNKKRLRTSEGSPFRRRNKKRSETGKTITPPIMNEINRSEPSLPVPSIADLSKLFGKKRMATARRVVDFLNVSPGRVTYPSFDVDSDGVLSYGFLYLGNLLTMIDTYTVGEIIDVYWINILETVKLLREWHFEGEFLDTVEKNVLCKLQDKRHLCTMDVEELLSENDVKVTNAVLMAVNGRLEELEAEKKKFKILAKYREELMSSKIPH